uniref:Zinc knuckle CX2CX4HX4C domain-containing protein n=1 Tax=Cannabis sativa TaxID=3483 RepID=A0A803PCV2_CANSA
MLVSTWRSHIRWTKFRITIVNNVFFVQKINRIRLLQESKSWFRGRFNLQDGPSAPAHHIPFGRKSPQLAQFIADEIGELIEIYPLSLLENFGPYLRLRILFDITKPLRHGMTIQFRGISNPKWINFKFESLSNFCYLCGLVDHTYNKCTKYLMRCDNFLLPPLLEYKETLRATTPAHHKRNPFEISNSTPYEEYFPRSIANNQILQQAVDQFLRVDTSTTGFAPPPAFVPALFSHSTIPPPIMTTSIITHTDKGKGIDVTMPSPSPPQSTRSAGPVIQEPCPFASPISSPGTRRPFTRQSAQVGNSVRSILKRARAVSCEDVVVPSMSDDDATAGAATRPRREK